MYKVVVESGVKFVSICGLIMQSVGILVSFYVVPWRYVFIYMLGWS